MSPTVRVLSCIQVWSERLQFTASSAGMALVAVAWRRLQSRNARTHPDDDVGLDPRVYRDFMY